MSEKKKSKYNSYQDVLDEIEKRRGYLSIDTSDVNADYIKSFMADSQKYFNDAQGIYDAINWGNASATYDERNAAWQALSERANKVGAYYYKNRNKYSNYDDIVSMLDELSSGGTGILDKFKNARNQYTQYQTEEDYKRAVAEAEAYNTTINSKDFAPLVEKGKANEKTLWEQDLQKLLTTSEYDKYTNPFEVAKDQWNNLTQGDWEEYIKTGIIGGLYSTFPQVAKPLEMFMKGLDIKDFADKWIIDGLRIDEQLSDAEKNMYFYYLGKEDYDKAQAYFDKLVEVAKSRKAENYALKYNDTFWELPMSLGAGVDSFVTGFDTAMSKLGNVVYDRESATYDPTTLQYAQGMMSSEKLVFNEETGKYETLWDANEGLWKVANDLAYTIGNQLPTIALNVATGGVAGAIPMGISAAGNAYSEMKKVKGVEDWQAMLYGVSIGTLEGVLSKALGGISGLGADGGLVQKAIQKALPNITSALGKFALTASASMLDEGIEEALQEVLDPIVQGIITGQISDDQDTIYEVLVNAAYSGALGALSAGALEVAPSGVNTIRNLNTTKNTYSGISSELVNDILSKNPNDAFALKMQDKLGKGKKLSGGNLAALVERGDRTAIESAITQKLTERGERGDVTKLSQALAKEAMGYGLSKAEANLIQSSDFGRSIQAELNPDNLSSNAEMDRWAEKIGTREVNPKQYNKQVEVKTIKEDGKVELESGKIVDAKSVSFANESDDLIFKVATERVSRVDGWTNETANAMIKGYDGKVTATAYRKAYISAFEMGKNGEQASQIVELANQTGIKGSTLLAAYDMGMQATEKALTNSTEGGKIESEVKTDESTGLRLRDSSKRNGSKDSQKQVSRVEESTGRDTSREDTERKVADSEAVKLADEGRKVKVSELGILNGSKTQTVTVVDKSQETSEMKRARKEAEKRGLKVRFFLGDNLVIEENGELISVRGYIKGEYVFVRADHPLYTSYQLMRHEIGHDMIAKGEVDINKVRAKLEETVGKENIDTVADMYALAYEKSGLDADAIWEECICDSLGDMNVFSDFADIDQGVVNMLLGDIKQATEDTKTAPNKTRGAPEGKASFEGYAEDGKGKYKSNFPKGTPKAAKATVILNYIQNVWSKKPIDLIITDDGKARTIKAQFDPTYTEDRNIQTDASKLMGGNRHGSSSDQRVTLDLADDYYQIALDSKYNYSKNEIGKENLIHKDIKRWHYFINDIYFAEYDSDNYTPYRVTINIKEKPDGTFVYSYSAEKQERLNTPRTLHAVVNGGETTANVQPYSNSISHPEKKSTPFEKNSFGKTSHETPDEARMSGKVSDAQFSREFASDIASNQLKRNAKDSKIDSKVLDKAISDAARMVEIMTPFEKLLPRDMVGKTLVKNGSYDISVENTTICIRTLAYNSFVDMVSEKVGRPLTQMESFLVSQKLYEIAKEPQCLYCYVSLDRKAFNEMIIRYTTQRDEAIAAYEEAGSPRAPKAMDENWSLFKEFLDGRKPTKNMWDRYVGWLEAYNKGERLITLEDISTEAKRLAIVEGKDVNAAAQVKDMLKYAQSASWAKKQTQYVAYYNDILKLSDNVVKNLNSHYGLRWYSFSDYSGAFILENMQQITDAAIRGLKGLSYTKDTDFAEIFATTGMNINISVYAKKGKNGYEIDEKQSADIKKAIELREKYPNVGIVVVATDKAGVQWALAQEWSDVVIPFHTVRTGADVAEFYNWEIFNAEQNDVVSDDNLWDAYVKSTGKKKVSKMVYPNEHQNNRETYLRICTERGLTPRFKSFLDNPNYMKLVNETRQSESATKPLKPIYDMDAAERSFGKFVEKGGYYEGWYNDGIDVDGEADIVASDVLSGKKANEVSYGRQDVSFEDIAKGRKTNRTHGKASRDLSIEGDSAVETKPLSNRELLANALLDTVQNEVEYKKLDDYKAVIKYLEAEETKLESLKEQIRSLDYSKDKAQFKELREEIRKTEARIDIHDKKLLQLESTQALKNVLERAKKEAYSKALAKGRETLHANVEGRHKTIERNRIKDIAHDLDKLLNKGTKKRNVKMGAQPIVSALLDITDRLLATDDELIMSGIVTETNSVEEDALSKYRELYNELHSTDDDVTNHKEERKEIRSKMHEVKKDLVDLLERERKRINKAKAKDSMTALIDEYAKLKNAKEGYLNLAYKQEVYDHLVTLRDNLKEKLVSEMTLDDLKDLHKACTMIQKMVTDSNKIFREGKAEDIKERVSSILGDVNKLSKREQDALAAFGNLAEGVESFNWKNLRPVDVFTIIGSPKLKELFWDAINAQDKYGANVNKITKDIVELRKKYGYKKWDTNKAMTIKTVDGDFKVTLGELMSIYAYSKREQADLHMSEGGFQHQDKAFYKDDKGLYRKRAKAEHPYRIGQLQRPEIISMLTKEQRDYVDALVDYITKYGEKGNEVSRTLYGIDLFTETHYFPLKSSHDFLASTQTQIGQTQTTSSLSNIGMSKPTTPNANNPIILQSFDDVILEHLDSMSKYNAYVIPIENLRKVLDFVDRDSNKSLKTIIGSRLGTGASNYLEQYITDLNGGKSAESGTLAKMFGRGKAAQVLASLSVWIQQYFSIIRAMSKVNPKYFIPFLGEKFKNPSMKLYEEMKTYAPITTIKEMGGFDVGSNRALKEYVGLEETKFNKNVLAKKANDIFGIGATLMDKAGWMTIWSAIKKEVAHEQGFKEGSKEYFEACRKRMNEVVTETQVYDSVNARSGMMRSKSELDKFATSFMGEPTVIVGMAETSVVKLKRAIASKDADAIKEALGDFAGVATSIVLSTAMTSLAKSLIYAMRDDDEDETFAEKYATALGSAIVNDINPMNYIPYARDISSIIDGWTVDRPDMQLIEDFVNASKKLLVYNEGDNLAEEGLSAALSFANLFGLPLKNALRDIKAMVNLVDTLSRNYKASTEGLLLKGVASGSWVLQTLLGDKGTLSKSEKLYRAMVDGDVSRLDYFKSTYEDEKSYNSALCKSLRDNDPRVEQAALARLNRDNNTYYNLMMDIIDEGVFSRSMVKEAFEAEYNYQKRLKEEAEK